MLKKFFACTVMSVLLMYAQAMAADVDVWRSRRFSSCQWRLSSRLEVSSCPRDS